MCQVLLATGGGIVTVVCKHSTWVPLATCNPLEAGAAVGDASTITDCLDLGIHRLIQRGAEAVFEVLRRHVLAVAGDPPRVWDLRAVLRDEVVLEAGVLHLPGHLRPFVRAIAECVPRHHDEEAVAAGGVVERVVVLLHRADAHGALSATLVAPQSVRGVEVDALRADDGGTARCGEAFGRGEGVVVVVGRGVRVIGRVVILLEVLVEKTPAE
mmetsp:Transcript_74246/g.187694  ORF Transcript_74246/g.187694 Transcript_74246/m.187694 type:complete len:213 (-) Transcript_74246:381-1019(-)